MPAPNFDVRKCESLIEGTLRRFRLEYERLESQYQDIMMENDVLRKQTGLPSPDMRNMTTSPTHGVEDAVPRKSVGTQAAEVESYTLQQKDDSSSIAKLEVKEQLEIVPFVETKASSTRSNSRSNSSGQPKSRILGKGTHAHAAKFSKEHVTCEVLTAKHAMQIMEEAAKYMSPGAKLAKVGQQPKSLKAHKNERHSMPLKRIVDHYYFDTFFAFTIVANSVIIGWETEWKTRNNDDHQVAVVLGHICSLIFLVELVLRVCASKLKFFFGENRSWNLFDVGLVSLSVFSFILQNVIGGETNRVGSVLKTLKMLRIIRLFRVFRFSRELSLLALMIIDSLKALVWALVMLAIILYTFAICFTQIAADRLKELAIEPDVNVNTLGASKYFGGLMQTIYTLVMSMMDGISWGEVSDVLITVSPFAVSLFFFYIAFTKLAVLNIVTGVFVENAVQMARTQRDYLMQQEISMREKYVVEMRSSCYLIELLG
eukprot:TRINITY_DN3960_c0_g5_i1.p1 TRINITY_DN3960_c0_g5~~TRINITY_DN3960_c0_g5_i1.p1  ORF type:complete len:486 (+),score=44.95 TRINITY_DN3960_c0_g5_i1:48-1505(+)